MKLERKSKKFKEGVGKKEWKKEWKREWKGNDCTYEGG
jgi:hypothetical protein